MPWMTITVVVLVFVVAELYYKLKALRTDFDAFREYDRQERHRLRYPDGRPY